MKYAKPAIALALCALVFGLQWFSRREGAAGWRFAPDVSLPGGSSEATSVAFSPDGHTLAVATMVFPATYPRGLHAQGFRYRRCEVQLWNVPSRLRQASLVISDKDGPRAKGWPEMSFSRNGKKLCYWGNGITTWDTKNAVRLSAPRQFPASFGAEYVNTLPLPNPWLNDEQLSSNCRAAVGSSDGLWYMGMFLNSPPRSGYSGVFLKIWHRTQPQAPWQLATTLPAAMFDNTLIYGMALSHNGKYCAVIRADGAAQLFTTSPCHLVQTMADTRRMHEIVFSQDGRYLVGCAGGELGFWNVVTGQKEHTISNSRLLRHPVFSADGRWLAAVEGDADVFVCSSPLALAKPAPNIKPTPDGSVPHHPLKSGLSATPR